MYVLSKHCHVLDVPLFCIQEYRRVCMQQVWCMIQLYTHVWFNTNVRLLIPEITESANVRLVSLSLYICVRCN